MSTSSGLPPVSSTSGPDDAPHFMTATQSSQQKDLKARPVTISSRSGSFKELLANAQSNSRRNSLDNKMTNGATQQKVSSMHPFADHAGGGDGKFGVDFTGVKPTASSSSSSAQPPPQTSNPVPYQPPEIAFPPLPEAFRNPAPSAVPSPVASGPEGQSAAASAPAASPPAASSPPAMTSPTSISAMDEIEAQAEQALADVERLLNDTAVHAGQDANVLRALTKHDEAVNSTEFESLIQNVVRDAITKTQQNAAASPVGQQKGSAAVADEIVRIRRAGQAMLESMNEIVHQIRALVLDPAFIDETLNKSRLNQEFQVDLVQAFRGRTPSASPQPGEATPVQGGAAGGAMTGKSDSLAVPTPGGGRSPNDSESDVDWPAQKPSLKLAPSRIQRLKEQLVVSGLRDLLHDMTQNEETVAQLGRRPSMALSEQEERSRLAGSKFMSPHAGARGLVFPSKESGSSTSPRLLSVPAPVPSPNSAAESEVQSLMEDLRRETLQTKEEVERKRKEEKDRQAREEDGTIVPQTANSNLKLQISNSPNTLAPRGLDPQALNLLSPASAAAGSGSSSAPTVGSPQASLDSIRSPRLQELMKLELVKAVRKLEKDETMARAERAARKIRAKEKRREARARGEQVEDSEDETASGGADNALLSPKGETPSSRRAPLSSGRAAASAAAESAAAAKLALELEKLQLEKDRLAFEAEKVRQQQEQYSALLAAQESRQASQDAAARESQRLQFEQMKLQLEREMMEEKLKMEQTRAELVNHAREIEFQRAEARAEANGAANNGDPKQPFVVNVTLPQPVGSVMRSPDGPQNEGESKEDAEAHAHGRHHRGASSSYSADKSDPATMQRNLEEYVRKRAAKKAKEEKARTIGAGSGSNSKRSSRRGSLKGALVIGSVATTQNETSVLQRAGGHSHHKSTSNVFATESAAASASGSNQQVGAAPLVQARGGSRNLLEKWTSAELTAPIPLKLFPSQEDIDALSAEERHKVMRKLTVHSVYDRLMQNYLDPDGSQTTAVVATQQVHSTANIVTPTVFLYLHLSLVDLHKISFLQKCRPVVEIYSLRANRTSLLYESEICPDAVTEFHPRPVLLKIEEVCYNQMERDIVIRVTHVADDDKSVPRVLLGEHWTNLVSLQSSPDGSKHPLLRARDGESQPKEKGTLVVHKQDLFVRTSYGLLAHPYHPNRLIPLTLPPIYDRATNCQVSFTPACSAIHLLGVTDGKGKHQSRLSKTGKLVPFLEFYRQEEDQQWSTKPVYRTEELLLSMNQDAEARLQAAKLGFASASATNSWKPVQLPLYDLCFGDISRPILVKLHCSGMVSSYQLATFHLTLGEILGKKEPCVIILDASFGREEQQAKAGVHQDSPEARTRTIGSGGLGGSMASLHGGSALALGGMEKQDSTTTLNAGDKPPCIAFQRAHVYSSLFDLQKMVQRAELMASEEGAKQNNAPVPSHPPPSAGPAEIRGSVHRSSNALGLSSTISGLHSILLDQARRKAGAPTSVEGLQKAANELQALNFKLPGEENAAGAAASSSQGHSRHGSHSRQPSASPMKASVSSAASASATPSKSPLSEEANRFGAVLLPGGEQKE